MQKRTFLFLCHVFFDVESESKIYFVRSSLVFELEGKLSRDGHDLDFINLNQNRDFLF